jgi:hypothetical protein
VDTVGWCVRFCFPALVPRGDFLDQLLKWSIIEFEENGRRGYGMKMVVDICEDYLNVRTPSPALLLAPPSSGFSQWRVLLELFELTRHVVFDACAQDNGEPTAYAIKLKTAEYEPITLMRTN